MDFLGAKGIFLLFSPMSVYKHSAVRKTTEISFSSEITLLLLLHGCVNGGYDFGNGRSTA